MVYNTLKTVKRKEYTVMIKDIITVSKGDWSADICPRLGGNVIKLTYKGEDVLRALTDEAELKINPYLWGAPILMPANRTYEGKFVFEGNEYSLPINEPHFNCNLHGLVLYEEFETVSATENEVTVMLTDPNCKSYPFPFRMTVTYTVTDEGLKSKYTVENIGEGNMPMTFCTHTTFTEPKQFQVPIDLNQERDKFQIPTGRYVELSEQEKGYVTGSPSEGLYISGYFHSCGNTAIVGDYEYTVSDNFNHWIFYNGGGGKGYLCVEPQSGKVNGLNYADGYNLLRKGETITFVTNIKRAQN